MERLPLEHCLLDVCGHVSELCWFVGRNNIENALFEQSNTIFLNISLSPRAAPDANCHDPHIFHRLSARAAAAIRSTTMMMRSTEVVAAAQHRRGGRVAARRECRRTAAIAVARDVAAMAELKGRKVEADSPTSVRARLRQPHSPVASLAQREQASAGMVQRPSAWSHMILAAVVSVMAISLNMQSGEHMDTPVACAQSLFGTANQALGCTAFYTLSR